MVTPGTDGRRPVLLVVGGLPGSGKSTVAADLASRLQLPFLRVDRIEHAIVAWSSLTHPVGAVGYAVAHAVAYEQLRLGLDVVVECVNPLEVTRDSWRSTAADAGAAILEVEMVCSDLDEHRHRVETRSTDVEGLVKPTWDEVTSRDYEPWSRTHLVLDSAETSAAECVALLVTELDRLRQP